MMFGSYHCIFGSTFFYQIHPSLRIILGGCETFFLLHVFIIGQVVVKEGPAFGHSSDGINSPMDKDTQLGL
jgi:hypothetical protein